MDVMEVIGVGREPNEVEDKGKETKNLASSLAKQEHREIQLHPAFPGHQVRGQRPYLASNKGEPICPPISQPLTDESILYVLELAADQASGTTKW